MLFCKLQVKFIYTFIYLKVTDQVKEMSKKIDYYTLLDIPKGATIQQIKKAYKKMAIKWHPDKNPDNKDEAVEKFRQISEAYQILSNQEKRRKYDVYGFDGPKLSSTSDHKFNFNDANDIFKHFFSSYGFENSSDSSFFNSYFKSYAGGGGSSTGSTGSTYFKYTTKPSSGSSYSYYSKPSEGSSYTSYSKPSDYYTKYTSSSGNTYTSSGNAYTSSGNTYTSSGTTFSSSTDNEQLPPQGQTIKKVHHVTRKFTNGSQETIVRTTVISSDGSKEITQQNLDGTNKKTYHVLGGAGTKKTQPDSPPKSSNFSGYNFGKRQSTTTAQSGTSNDQGQKKDQSKAEPEAQKKDNLYQNLYGGSFGNSNSYKTYYTTSSGTNGGTSYGNYKIPSDYYANVKRAYSGGTKVYYADGSQGVYDGGSFGTSTDNDKKTTKIYYTVRK